MQLQAIWEIIFLRLKCCISLVLTFSYLKLTMTLTNEGGTFKASGIMIDPRFVLVSWSNILNQSMLNMVKSPGSSRVIVLFL